MAKRGAAWREAAVPFVVSRIVIVILTYLAGSIIGNARTHQTVSCFHSVKSCLLMWNQYDANLYVYTAHMGYTSVAGTAFFPLWPILIHVVGLPFTYSLTRYVFISLVLSNLLFYLALVVFYCLIYDLLRDERIARNALFYLSFAPYAIFFFVGYTESLFLLLCLLTFFCLQRALQKKRLIYWLLAGGTGFLATLTRSQGIFLMLPYVLVFVLNYLWPWSHPLRLAEWRTLFHYELWRQRFVLTTWREKILSLLPLFFIPMSLGLYMLYLWQTKGNPTAFSVGELHWYRHFTLPWTTIAMAVPPLFVVNAPQENNILNMTYFLLPLLILILGWRRLPLYYSLFALLLLVFPLCYPAYKGDVLTSLPRYMLIVFPIYIILATIKAPRFEKAWLALTPAFFAFNCVLLVLHYWVA
jgi:Predicted integral membrane protein